MFRLYNFLTKKIEEFKPISKTVGLYTCGPTVYDYVHIGNWRTFVFEDILKRTLLMNNFKVRHVMNITDIEDKIIKRSREEGIRVDRLTAKYEKEFFNDLEKLNIKRADVYPRAKEHVNLMIKLIESLIEKGFAYKKERSIYFSISKFEDYGKLSGANLGKLKVGARVDADEYDKENPRDFALWKSSMDEKGEKREGIAFDSPWGVGRPGWHIECSAMSMHYLGDPSTSSGRNFDKFRTIDIHTGGVDLLFPHHENEIAQSEGATGKKFVNFWLEGEHLLVEGDKMAKSEGNIFTLGDISKRGFEPLALRYLFLTAHWRSKLNFTWKSLEAAQNALDNLREEISTWDEPNIGCAGFEGDFKSAINDDLNTPGALSVLWELVKSDYPTSAKNQSIQLMDEILGLGLAKITKGQLPKGAVKLIKEREKLRSQGKFAEADKLRLKLNKMGVFVEDTRDGSKWRVKK